MQEDMQEFLRRERKVKKCVRKAVRVYRKCSRIIRTVPQQIMDRGWFIRPRVFQRVSRRTVTIAKKVRKLLLKLEDLDVLIEEL